MGDDRRRLRGADSGELREQRNGAGRDAAAGAVTAAAPSVPLGTPGSAFICTGGRVGLR